jgi:hypothetical protein
LRTFGVGYGQRVVETQLRRYRRLLVGPERVVGWCESCGFLAEGAPGQDLAVRDRLARHQVVAHAPARAPGGVEQRELVPA